MISRKKHVAIAER